MGEQSSVQGVVYEERAPGNVNGMAALVAATLLNVAAVGVLVAGAVQLSEYGENFAPGVAMFLCGLLYMVLVGWIPYLGLKVIKPNEALVLTLFGRYCGTLKREGFYCVNPFVVAVNPAAGSAKANTAAVDAPAIAAIGAGAQAVYIP